MQCAEFREEYQRYLDKKVQGGPPDDLCVHMDLCPACTSYAGAMHGIDQALQAMPDAEIPPGLLTSLRELPASLRETRETGLVAYVGRYAALILAALVAWIVGSSASEEVQLLLNGLILAAGAFAFTAGLLKPLYLHQVPDS